MHHLQGVVVFRYPIYCVPGGGGGEWKERWQRVVFYAVSAVTPILFGAFGGS